MPKTWSGRPREFELRPTASKGIPPVLIAFILFTVCSLTATLGTAVYCITHPYVTGYDKPVITVNAHHTQGDQGTLDGLVDQ